MDNFLKLAMGKRFLKKKYSYRSYWNDQDQ